jgi:parallel beta-helix repeat protein
MGLQMKKLVVPLFIISLIIISICQMVMITEAQGIEIYVDSAYRGYSDGTAERPYKTIQYAIDIASTDDTIYVFGGEYDEIIIIDKKITLWGSIDDSPSIIDTDTDIRYTMEITADYAEVQSFTFSDSGNHKSSPIGALIAVKADNVIVQGNTFNQTDSYGIYLDTSGHGSVIGGNTFSNTKRGICVGSSNTNDIFNNDIQNCADAGIYISDSSNTRCYANIIQTSLIGITVSGSSNLNLTGNDISSCEYYSVHLENTNSGHIKNNTIHDNNGGGLYHDATGMTITENVFEGNVRGIFLVGTNNQIYNNTFGNQTAVGISTYEQSANNLLILNKFIDNAKNAQDDGQNVWYSDLQGNYWSDYGFVDRDLDGIGDISYQKNGITDLYPLGFFLKPPKKPSNPDPEDMEEGVGLKITFRVKIQDPDSDQVTVYFYRYRQNQTDLLIGTDKRISSGEYAQCLYTQPFDTTFIWYAIANDSILENMSDIWYFTTKATPPDNIPPIADPGGPYESSTDTPVEFDASASNDTDGSIDFYRWNFDDGSSEILAKQPNHLYTSPGTYTVTLTVIDDDGASDTMTTPVVITEIENILPVAQPGGPYDGFSGKTIMFNGVNSTDIDGMITNFTWQFGDNSIGYGEYAFHSYTKPGTYLVILTVTDDDGESHAAQVSVDVSEQVESPGFVLVVFLIAIYVFFLRERRRKYE